MDAPLVEDFRQQLLRIKAELEALEEMAEESIKPVILDQTSTGRLTRMDAMQGQQMALETARRRQQQLRKIEAALRRIESGDFGDCVVCGEEIDPRRMAIDPTATRCIGCAEV